MNTESKKLESLLYRKHSSEKRISIWSKGIKTYNGLREACLKVINNKDESSYRKAEAEVKIHEIDIPLKHYITSLKLTKREYENYIMPEIEKLVSEEDKNEIEFKDLEKETKELADIEVFASHSKMPENVELVEVNKDLVRHIGILEGLIKSISDKIKNASDEYEKSKLELDLFEYNLRLISNRKRLNERLDYYNNQFLPKYKKDMEEADKYLDAFLERAKELVRLGVDVKLQFMLDEYEKNKSDKEKVWLFYTALKSRINKIGKEMRKNKHKFKGNMHLAEKIIK